MTWSRATGPRLPFSDGVFTRSYVFGDFVNDLVLPCVNCAAQTAAGNAIGGTAAEAARTTIAAALSTW